MSVGARYHAAVIQRLVVVTAISLAAGACTAGPDRRLNVANHVWNIDEILGLSMEHR